MCTNRFVVAALAVSLFLPAAPPNQTELTQPDSQNVLLISELRLVGNIQGIAVAGDYIYVAAGSTGLHIIDAAQPATPQEVGFLDTPGDAKDVVLSGDYAYVADGNSGLRVIDVSLPDSPAEVGFYDTPGEAKRVFAAGDYVYIADGSGGLRIVDVTNVQNPLEVGYYPTEAIDVEVMGQYAYLAETMGVDCGFSGGVLRLLDVSDPMKPISISATAKPKCYPYNSYFLSVAVEANYVYVGTGDRVGGRLNLYDAAALSQIGGGFLSLGSSAREVAVEGDTVYVATGGAGISIVSYVVPAMPKGVGYYNTPGYALDIAVANGFAYIADDWGMVILRPLLQPIYMPFVVQK